MSEKSGIRSNEEGTVSSPFEITSEVEETRRERFEKLYDTYVHTPVEIIWSDWRARIGAFILVIYLLMAIVGPSVVDPVRTGEGGALVQPFTTAEFPLGTDDQGRDLFAMTVYSARPMLIMMFSGAITTIAVGTGAGAVAGYRGGWIDNVVSAITDIFINIPGYPLVMTLSLLLPISGNPVLIGILISVMAWGGLSRKMRSQVLTLRNESFIEASRSIGQPSRLIVWKDILPHLMPYAMINLASTARRIIFTVAGLYFLGILPYGDPNWGVMLNRSYQAGAFYRPQALHWFLIPAVVIIVIGVGLVLLSQSLDRVFNPRVRARHEKRTDSKSPMEEL
ncbi:ABC transporter permease [Haloarchaeobius sp. DFWS5]|uniref:ABC transporter permease n=1 Tax=Haloarchaeobius sp. DFWS5 TaxID=3446114 RepID=UPI003EC0C0C6